MFRIILLLIALLLFIPCQALCDIHASDDCTYAKVAAAVAAADDGDTVTIPACSETSWDTNLIITKAIILQGAGAGSTNITTSVVSAGVDGIIQYKPDTADANHRFRLTGITINGSNIANCVYLYNPAQTAEYVRIDNCAFSVTYGTEGTPQCILATGQIFGVIDNNAATLTNQSHFIRFGGSGETTWGWYYNDREPGTSKNLFLEDNVITVNSQASGPALFDAGGGGRGVFRYNTVSNPTTGAIMSPVSDMHGGQPATWGGMLIEQYGNYLYLQKGTGNLFDQRGGQAMYYYNYATYDSQSVALWMREEYPDSLYPSTNSYLQHVTGSYYFANYKKASGGSDTLVSAAIGSENCCATAPAWQASTAYGGLSCYSFAGDTNGNCWKASVGGTSGESEPTWTSAADDKDTIVDGGITWLNVGSEDNPIAENVDMWTQRAQTYDGTVETVGTDSGVGCGALGDRPATCTQGSAYFATDQSCSDISAITGAVGRVGGRASTDTKVIGTLYICGASNWTDATTYTPYTYPHPLRGTGKATATIGSGSVMSIGAGGATATLY